MSFLTLGSTKHRKSDPAGYLAELGVCDVKCPKPSSPRQATTSSAAAAAAAGLPSLHLQVLNISRQEVAM